jgi:hypothetical protein
MALSTAELLRVRAELGFNVLSNGAAPFIGVTSLFDTIIAQYMTAGAATTSSTAVTAAASATPVPITLASATGFATGERIWLDVDDRLESATIQSLSGAVATVDLIKAHSGTYPVYVDGGEAMVREKLNQIKSTKAQMAGTFGAGALKKVDEVEFYQSRNFTWFGSLGEQLMFWRDELAALLGAPNLWRQKRAAGSTIALY